MPVLPADRASAYHASFTLGTPENYLNDPPAGYKNNSFQITAGLTYALKSGTSK